MNQLEMTKGLLTRGIPKLLEQSVSILMLAAILFFVWSDSNSYKREYIDHLKSENKALVAVVEKNNALQDTNNELMKKLIQAFEDCFESKR